MTMQMILQEEREEGLAIGREEGRAEGENLLGSLIQKLLSQGRTKDAELAAKDAYFRKQLYKEFELI